MVFIAFAQARSKSDVRGSYRDHAMYLPGTDAKKDNRNSLAVVASELSA